MVDLELFRKYWSVLLIAVLVGFFGYRLRPTTTKHERQVPQPGVLGPTVEAADGEEVVAEEKPAPLPLEPTPSGTAEEEPRLEMQEFLIVVPSDEVPEAAPRTYTQDSPEVKAALSKLKIEIYSDVEENQASDARAFLSHNALSFTDHDTNDVNVKERVRRLTGDGEQTVMVIDGQVLRDLSPEGIQKGLLEATKKRVLDENGQPRLPETDSTLP